MITRMGWNGNAQRMDNIVPLFGNTLVGNTVVGNTVLKASSYQSSEASGNIIPMRVYTQGSNLARNNGALTKGQKYEVYPFKEQKDIDAMQIYFLKKANASSGENKKIALRNLLYFSLSINIGFRGGDVSSMKWGDYYGAIGQDYYYYHEQKTGKQRELVFNEDCSKSVGFYLKNTGVIPSQDDYIFPSRKGNSHMTCDSFRMILKEAAEACGIKYNVGTHSLRKTFGYRYYKNTGDLETLQKIFGHSSSRITLRYIGIDHEVIKNAYSQIQGALMDTEEMAQYL